MRLMSGTGSILLKTSVDSAAAVSSDSSRPSNSWPTFELEWMEMSLSYQ